MALPTVRSAAAGDTYTHHDVNQHHVPRAEKLAYTGEAVDGNSPADNQSADLTTYDHASKFTMVGTVLDRVEVKLIKTGTGANLTIELRADNAGSPSATVIASRTIPKEWVPTTATVISVGFPVTGLTNAASYWLVLRKAGDGVSNCKWRSLNSADASHVAKRATDNATWSSALTEEMYLIPYANGSTFTELVNVDAESGLGQEWLQYSTGVLQKACGRLDDVRWIETLTYSSGTLVSDLLTAEES
jgi:hypothetical protein